MAYQGTKSSAPSRLGTKDMRRPPDTRTSKTTTRRSMLLGAVSIIAFGALVVFVIGYHQYYKDLEKYCDIKTADNREEVLYRMGFPATVLDDSQKNYKYPGRRSYDTNRKAANADPDKVIPDGKTVSDYFEWSYVLKNLSNNSTANVFVDFDRASRRIENVDCVDFTDQPHLCPPLVGISVGDSEDRVKDKLGKADRYELDGVTKTMTYNAIGVEFKLTKGNVYYLRLSGKQQRNYIPLLYYYIRGMIF